jgi:SAM-dependent methyltransferase
MIHEEWQKKELWDNYWSRPYKNYRKHHELFWGLILNNSSGAILDLGCGPACIWEGRNKDITGVDYSVSAIEEAKKNVPDGKFLVADLNKKLPLKEKFDVIVLCGVINYFPDLTNLKSEVKRLSKNRETLVLITINDLEGLNNRFWDEYAVKEEFSSWGRLVSWMFYPKIGWLIKIVC